MCGIAGWIAGPDSPLGMETLVSMLQAMAHRGPDGEGARRFHCRGSGQQVFLGHRRLAIIDLEGAQQPMCDAQAGLALSFNGEIYNFRELRRELQGFGYRFSRDSDTEVLLRAYQHWGSEVAHHLRGMFAFAIWDARARRLFLARDRFGEKPMFLHEDRHGLYFASEIKALLRIPGVGTRIDLEAVWDYLAYRYVPGPRTLFDGVRKLMPGTTATWERGRLQETRYWSAPDGAATVPNELQFDFQFNVVEEFLARLDEAVRLQMVSDVPFGAFLSGGLDSSTIVALMSRHGSAVRTFSVGFSEQGYSELAHAAQVAAHLGTRHHEIVVSQRDMTAWLPALVAFRDAPVSEPSDIPIHMMAREAARSVKMVLTGEGSDEILGGYPKHVAERFAGSYGRLPAVIRHRLIEPIARALPYGFRRAKTALANLNIEDRNERYVRWFGALNHAERARLTVLRVPGEGAATAPQFDAAAQNSSLRRILYFDQSSWLPDNLLERGDRMTMAASLEARVPFLDHSLAEFVSGLPDRFRVRGLRGKWILRQAARQLIPASILNRPKVGFRVPVHEWLRGDMREFLRDHLQGAGSRIRAYFDPRRLDQVMAEHFAGRQNNEKLLWSLLNLEIWHRRYAGA
jgi:asparagine synthase (glutamine-hydrolysing)